MTSEQVYLVRESFETMRDRFEVVTRLFYGRLFDVDPSLRALFKIDMREQTRKMVDMLSSLVDSLDRMDELRPQLREMGRRHVGYGVRPEHYALVSSALIWAIGQALGEESYPEVREAWAAVIADVSREMLLAPEPETA